MTYCRLAIQILLAVIVLVAANVVVSVLARNSNPRQLLRSGDEAEPATDLFLGNSLMAAGLDTTAFAAVKPGRPLNLSLGSSSPVEHALIYQRQGKHRGATVYYGFFDSQLTDLQDGGWEKLVGNRAMAYYVEPETAIGFYAPDSPLRSCGHRLVARIPVLVERHTIWSKVEKLRRLLGEIGMPRKDTNRFGRAEDFVLLEADPDEFASRCSQAVADRVPLNGPLRAIFHQANGRNSPVLVVEMPMTEQHRQRFYSGPAWEAYRSHLIECVREAGGVYVPAADWVGQDGFADHLHMNAVGARAFSSRLARWVQQTQ
jgi:hypothetical protein